MVKKSLTVGFGGADAPATRTGAAAVVKESVDGKVKTITWGDGDMKRLKIKKKKKKSTGIKKGFGAEFDKELFRTILRKAYRCYPDADVNEIAHLAMEVYKKKQHIEL